MALPHLPRPPQAIGQQNVEERRRLEAAAKAHERLVSPESYTRSLEAYVALRTAARKAEGIVQRRARLCSLLREERLQQISALRALQPPPPENLWADMRPPGFFEGLYSDAGTGPDVGGTAPPHLRSTYQAELWGQPLEERQEDKTAWRAALLEQAHSKKAREAADADKDRENDRQMLQRMEQAQKEAVAKEQAERLQRRAEVQRGREAGRQSKAEAAAVAAAVEAEAEREAKQLDERREEKMRAERERSWRLDREAREEQRKALQERERTKEGEELRKAEERRWLERDRLVMVAEAAEEEEKKRRAMEGRKAMWKLQEEEKRVRKALEKKTEEVEREEERRAEEAYKKLLEFEKEKMRRIRTKPPWAVDDC